MAAVTRTSASHKRIAGDTHGFDQSLGASFIPASCGPQIALGQSATQPHRLRFADLADAVATRAAHARVVSERRLHAWFSHFPHLVRRCLLLREVLRFFAVLLRAARELARAPLAGSSRSRGRLRSGGRRGRGATRRRTCSRRRPPPSRGRPCGARSRAACGGGCSLFGSAPCVAMSAAHLFRLERDGGLIVRADLGRRGRLLARDEVARRRRCRGGSR